MTDAYVALTEKAADRIKAFLAEEPELPPLRLALVRTRCMGGRGHAYDLQVAEGRKDGDVASESRGITFLIDATSAPRVHGLQVDYVETLQESGFAITNPNAVGKCPCGHHDLFA